jgi:hypothetical protein
VAALVLLLPRTVELCLLHAAAGALCSQYEQLLQLRLIPHPLRLLLLLLLLLLPLEVVIPAELHQASTAEVLTSLLPQLHHSLRLAQLLAKEPQLGSATPQAVLLQQRLTLQQAHCRLPQLHQLLQSWLGCLERRCSRWQVLLRRRRLLQQDQPSAAGCSLLLAAAAGQLRQPVAV